MRIQNFEDVTSWKIGKELYLELSKTFESTRDFTFKDQLLRATLSITNNITEGFDRGSDREFRQFLVISRGSCAEVRSMLHLALGSDKITQDQHDISKLLTGFIKKLETRNKRLETT